MGRHASCPAVLVLPTEAIGKAGVWPRALISIGAIEFNGPPATTGASIDDFHLVDLAAGWRFPVRVLLPLFGRDPGDEASDNVSARTRVELRVYADVYFTGRFRKSDSIDLKIVELQNLDRSIVPRTLRTVGVFAVGRNRFCRPQKSDTVFTDFFGVGRSLRFAR